MARKPHLLIILDGFGHSESSDSNAISAAQMPHWQALLQSCPHGLISGSGEDVGLPDGQMGNSEVGHMNLGAGRVVYQDFTRITKAIRDGEFASNPAIAGAVAKAVAAGKAVHILGLLSAGGVHSHEDHLHAMVDAAVAQGAQQVYVHAFLDGRDTPPRSAEPSLAAMEAHLRATGKGRIATVIGRYFAMDRDNRWDRVESAYRLLTEGIGARTCVTAVQALQESYAAGVNDEFVTASVIAAEGESPAVVADGDAVIFMNFRADRAREITKAFVDSDFKGFVRARTPQLADFVMLTEYSAAIKAAVAYRPTSLVNSLGEYLAGLGKTQLRIAETEKYAHVTFFFSGGREEPYAGETRILVPSPNVATYDLQPEMSAIELTERALEKMQQEQFDFVCLNFANADMVGHTGVYSAIVKAVETVDACLQRLVEVGEEMGYEFLVLADHGNADVAVNDDGTPNTAHTTNPVPVWWVTQEKEQDLRHGILADVAPTILHILGLVQPLEMTGKSLIV